MKIADEIENISRKTLLDVFSNLVKKMYLCVSVEEEHFGQLLELDLYCDKTSMSPQRNFEKLI